MIDPRQERPEPEDLSTIRQPPPETWGHPASGLEPSHTAPGVEPTSPQASVPEAEHTATWNAAHSQPAAAPAPDRVATPPASGGSRSPGDTANDPSLSESTMSAAAQEIRPGQVLFDRYIAESLIGTGGMGTVWKVKHKALGVSRAIKLIRPQIAFDPKTRADFRREATIMATLQHPHAVIIHDARIGTDLAYIEMEYLQGNSVERLLEPGEPMPLDWVTRILLQLCELLEFVHSKGIIHRDLKPSNLFLLAGYPEGREFLKVLDFGIAKSLNRDFDDPADVKTSTGAARFTPHYASPEQVGGAKDLDARSDLYSVGVILYEFLTGYRPFSEPSLIYQHLCAEPPAFKVRNRKATVPAEVEAVVMRCLAKNPKDRPQTAGELAAAFIAAVEANGMAVTRAAGSGTRWEGRSTTPSLSESRAATPAPPTHEATLPTDRQTGLLTIKPPGANEWVEPKPSSSKKLIMGLVGVPLGIGLLFVVLYFALKTLRPPGTTTTPPEARTTEPTKPTTPEPKVPRPSLAFGYQLDGNTKVSATGWPEEIVESSTQNHFMLFADGIYIPSGYSAENPKELVNGWPRVLVRKEMGGARFIRIAGGTFTMGGLDKFPAKGELADLPMHDVTLSDFYISETEVTNAQFDVFRELLAIQRSMAWTEKFEALGPGDQARMRDRPATYVNHIEAVQFARWAWGRLPTEAEWEYAARSGGLKNLYPWGNTPADKVYANIDLAESDNMSAIPTSAPGAYQRDRTVQGIFDLAGNVREWCNDEFSAYTARPVIQGSNIDNDPKPDRRYVVRGSSFALSEPETRTTRRSFEKADQRADDLGFRIVLKVPPTMKPAGN